MPKCQKVRVKRLCQGQKRNSEGEEGGVETLCFSVRKQKRQINDRSKWWNGRKLAAFPWKEEGTRLTRWLTQSRAHILGFCGDKCTESSAGWSRSRDSAGGHRLWSAVSCAPVRTQSPPRLVITPFTTFIIYKAARIICLAVVHPCLNCSQLHSNQPSIRDARQLRLSQSALCLSDATGQLLSLPVTANASHDAPKRAIYSHQTHWRVHRLVDMLLSRIVRRHTAQVSLTGWLYYAQCDRDDWLTTNN